MMITRIKVKPRMQSRTSHRVAPKNQRAYPAQGEGESLSKENLFNYIYGLLHSPDYRSRYADNLGKELPRLFPSLPRARLLAPELRDRRLPFRRGHRKNRIRTCLTLSQLNAQQRITLAALAALAALAKALGGGRSNK